LIRDSITFAEIISGGLLLSSISKPTIPKSSCDEGPIKEENLNAPPARPLRDIKPRL
jgi:hypothetical protein